MTRFSMFLMAMLTSCLIGCTYSVKSSTFEEYVVAETIWREARGESQCGRMAVASVISNRMKERGMSGAEVCLEHGQFSCWGNGRTFVFRKKRLCLSDEKVWIECVSLAKSITSKRFRATINANHYYNPQKSNPSWGRKMKNVKVIGRHRFGRV